MHASIDSAGDITIKLEFWETLEAPNNCKYLPCSNNCGKLLVVPMRLPKGGTVAAQVCEKCYEPDDGSKPESHVLDRRD